MGETSSVTLEVRDLQTYIAAKGGDGVSFFIKPGEVFGLAGESGSGKSMTAFSIMRLLPLQGRIAGGSVLFKGENITAAPEARMRDLRGDRIAMIFQDPMTSLNPVFTIGDQLSEPLRQHQGLDEAKARAKAIELLANVGIPDPAKRYTSYPHEFSGGMRQRVMIAMALACSPDLLIADEPTTALDVTIEKQILALIEELREGIGAAILLITHNLALLAEHCDRIAVMYAGQIVETAPTDVLLSAPAHPYTKALLGSMPRTHISQGRLKPLTGLPPVIIGERKGCAFAPRCPSKTLQCESVEPVIREIAEGHEVRCLLFGEGA